MKILVVDDERKMCNILKAILEDENYSVATAESGQEALRLLGRADSFDLIITDLMMPEVDGMAILRTVKERKSPPEVIIMTAYATVQTALAAMKMGAYDYIIKPFEMDELKFMIKRLADQKRLISENIELKQQLEAKYEFENFIGRSAKMMGLFELVKKVISGDTTILLRGESGTGKALLAQAIHYNSPRREKPFVKVHCSAFPGQLLEHELFGYEKGAFPGAQFRKLGRLDLAGDGTIFLDEIGDIELPLQAKLLRAVQDKIIVRVGGIETISVHARIIATTNVDLEKALQEKRFREDLYYRLNVFPLFIPPLRERVDDIPDLCYHFLKGLGHGPEKIDKEAITSLMNYPWPGNVQELENIVERMVVLSGEGIITADMLPPHIRESRERKESSPSIGANYLP
ncbi:MAG: sigma-54 dependent transcriptional regulator [bacterium]